MNWLRKLFCKKSEELILRELEKVRSEFDSYKIELNQELKRIDLSLEGSITKKIVTKKLDGYKKELEFIELSTKIYILDDGYRKVNPPYVTLSSKGVLEGKAEPGATKLRCYVLKRFVIPGYYKEDELVKDDSFQEFFGKTYREIVAHMAEHNYHHDKNEMYCLNFHEI